MALEKKKYDWWTIGLYLMIVLFGWFNIYAAVYNEAHTSIFDFSVQHGKQIIWMGIAFFLALLITVVEPRVFSNTAYIIYGVVLMLLVVVLFIGQTTNGGQSWINFGSFKFQPSEFAKFGTALALSKYMSGIGIEIKDMRTKIIAFTILLIPAALVLLQHDTGSALVFASFIFPLYREGLPGTILVLGVAAILLFVLTLVMNKFILLGILLVLCLFYLFVWLNKRNSRTYWITAIFFICCAGFVMSVDFAFNNILEPHQQERIDVLLGKEVDMSGAGYNVNQAKIAIGSGGFLGKGWCDGTITKADFVPEQETDFIFCTVGEEWGFFGSTLLVVAYICLLVRLVTLAERQRSTFSRFYGYSVASILFMHIFINIGMVLGLLPVIGIPLPFFSYGGSSLLAFTILLFIFIRQDADRNSLL
ncbi:MAG: rod shape-determining protein RodA [Bacteroidales bacterium]|nr:rod shape-determining protein RodA [Bacteroidales bacterium]